MGILTKSDIKELETLLLTLGPYGSYLSQIAQENRYRHPLMFGNPKANSEKDKLGLFARLSETDEALALNTSEKRQTFLFLMMIDAYLRQPSIDSQSTLAQNVKKEIESLKKDIEIENSENASNIMISELAIHALLYGDEHEIKKHLNKVKTYSTKNSSSYVLKTIDDVKNKMPEALREQVLAQSDSQTVTQELENKTRTHYIRGTEDQNKNITQYFYRNQTNTPDDAQTIEKRKMKLIDTLLCKLHPFDEPALYAIKQNIQRIEDKVLKKMILHAIDKRTRFNQKVNIELPGLIINPDIKSIDSFITTFHKEINNKDEIDADDTLINTVERLAPFSGIIKNMPENKIEENYIKLKEEGYASHTYCEFAAAVRYIKKDQPPSLAQRLLNSMANTWNGLVSYVKNALFSINALIFPRKKTEQVDTYIPTQVSKNNEITVTPQRKKEQSTSTESNASTPESTNQNERPVPQKTQHELPSPVSKRKVRG